MKQKLQNYFGNNNTFFLVIVSLIIIAGLVFNQPTLAMWFGFGVAAFSAISNDSIQTLGTFLSSNNKVNWKILWLFIGGIMVTTIYVGWLLNSGDISYGRLNKVPQPQSFSFVQLLAPIILIILTRFKMPVSTTFLILATFSSAKTIQGMLTKTFTGYLLAFVMAFVVWGIIGYTVNKHRSKIERKMSKSQAMIWRTLQWISTAFLWSAWLAQDNANAAVFLPRDVTGGQLIGILSFMTLMMGYIMYKRGGQIQEIITEKTDVVYVKSATIIDFVYACILVYFKWINDLPMSTTWVFLGLLAGREIALRATLHKNRPYKQTLKLVQKDLLRAGFGLGVSLALAFLANSQL